MTAIFLLAAAADPSYQQNITDGLRRGITDPNRLWPISYLVVVGLLLALLLIGLWLWKWRNRQFPGWAGLVIFHHLADELELSLPDQWLLVRIARVNHLPNPLVLLLSPATLEHHARQFAADLPQARSAALAGRMAAISRRLFTEPHQPKLRRRNTRRRLRRQAQENSPREHGD